MEGARKTYLITGSSGQDGFFSSRYFLKKGMRVVGTSRQNAVTAPHLKILLQYPHYQHVPIGTYSNEKMDEVIGFFKPDRIIHCAGYRDIPKTKSEEDQCFFTNVDITSMLLRALVKHVPQSRLLFLSSAEIFDKSESQPYHEQSVIRPNHAYGVSKVQGMDLINHYRERFNFFGTVAICFNHDSCFSPPTHLARLVPQKLIPLKLGKVDQVRFFNVDVKRDWSHAQDFVTAFDRILEHGDPDRFILSSGKPDTLKNYIDVAATILNIDPGQLVFETLPDAGTYDRIGDASKIKRFLGWRPRYSLEGLCKNMLQHEMRRAQGKKNIA